jgi:hypothetical protein
MERAQHLRSLLCFGCCGKKLLMGWAESKGSASFCCCVPSRSVLCLRKYQTGKSSFVVLTRLQMLPHLLIVLAGRGCIIFDDLLLKVSLEGVVGLEFFGVGFIISFEHGSCFGWRVGRDC